MTRWAAVAASLLRLRLLGAHICCHLLLVPFFIALAIFLCAIPIGAHFWSWGYPCSGNRTIIDLNMGGTSNFKCVAEFHKMLSLAHEIVIIRRNSIKSPEWHIVGYRPLQLHLHNPNRRNWHVDMRAERNLTRNDIGALEKVGGIGGVPGKDRDCEVRLG